MLPLMLFALFAALLIPGDGWVLFAFFKLILVFWLVSCLAGALTAGRIHRRARRGWQPGCTQHRRR
jgi:hypothetical protein